MIRLFIVAALCLFLFTGCVEKMAGNLSAKKIDQPVLETVDREHKKAMLDIGEEQDRRQMQSRGLGLVANETFEGYANGILGRLKTASGVKNVPGRVYLVAENGWSARTSANGNIYIPLGMLGDIDSEDVFAALLAHELSHAIMNHTDSDIFVKASKKTVVATSFVNKMSGTADLESDVYLASMGTFAASELFLSPSWSRGQETEADLMGLDILIRAGYAPNAMEALLEIVEVLDERNRLEYERRQKQLQAARSKVRNDAIKNLDYTSLVAGVAADSFKFVTGKLKRFTEDHASGKDRIDTLRTYKKQHYRRSPRKKYTTDSWRTALNTEEIRQAMLALDKAHLAHNQLMNLELTQGVETIRSSINSSTDKQNYVRKVFAAIRAAEGKDSYALKNHQLALSGKYPSLESHEFVAKSSIEKASSQDARVEHFDDLMTAFNDYGKPPEYYRNIVLLAESLQLQTKAEALKAECNVKYAGDGVSCSREQHAEQNNLSFKKFFQ